VTRRTVQFRGAGGRGRPRRRRRVRGRPGREGRAEPAALRRAAARYDFVVGDLFAYLDRPKPCDVVFCFGILSHTTEHMRLLSRIAELLPRHLIIDTNVSRRESAVIELRKPLTGYPPKHGGELEAYPTTAAHDAMLSSFGRSYTYFNWEASGLTSHAEMQDYGAGRRISVVVDCMKPSISIAEQQAAVEAVRARRHD